MSTPYYRIAHQILPAQAAKNPTEVWAALSSSDWSTWLATIAVTLGEPVRGVGVEGVLTGSAVTVRDGVELLAMYFPAPSGPGEPYFAVLARPVGKTELRSFVFELGISQPGEALRVVMAEWRTHGEGVMRLRFDVADDASLDTCLRRTVEIMNEDGVPVKAPSPAAASYGATKTGEGKSSPAAIALISIAILVLIGAFIVIFAK